MTFEQQIFAALSPLVPGVGGAPARVYPDEFPQLGLPNPWPAIRYVFVDAVPVSSVCGTGGDLESDIRIQFDGVAASGTDRDALRLAIEAAMLNFPTPNFCDSWSKSYDADAKGYRIQLDYLLQPSSA